MARKKKTNWGDLALNIGLTGAGMFAGSQVSNIAERNLLPADMAPYAGGVTAVAGGVVTGFLPSEAKPVGVGMAAQGIADLGESLINMAMTKDTTAQGYVRTLRKPAVGSTQAGGRRMNPHGRRQWASKTGTGTA